MKFQEIIDNIDVWYNWIDQYKKYVPKFIEEAKTKVNYSDWDSEVFNEFFEKNRDQCVSSLQQGYYTYNEKQLIKENWLEIAPYLKKIAENQEFLDLETYDFINKWFRKFTTQNRKASANRIIASLQPNLLCTIVNEDRLIVLMHKINNISNTPVFTITNNWFKNSNAVSQFFKENIPHEDVMDLITYPWQTYDYFINEKPLIANNDMSEENNDYSNEINLLEYKKQIILQGPPGTGKTRLAKEITKEMIPVTSEFIKNKITVGKIIPTAKGQVSYKVLSVTEEKIVLEREKGTINDTTISRIIAAFEEQKWNNEIKNNDDRMAVALAKYLFDDFFADNEQFKLIQFHPSYTYEDFVRGIVAKPNPDGEGIIYEAENKTLGDFATKALDNFLASKGQLTIDSEFQTRFNTLIDEINSEINSGKIFKFGDKSTAEIISVGNEYLIYSFPERKEIRYKLLFSDIEKVYNKRQEINIPIDLRDKEKELGLQMKGKYPYYFMILKSLEKIELPENFNLQNSVVEEKPYILIIDEINRANLSSVLGELIYALEYRGKAVESMYSVENSILNNKNQLILPDNLYIIGTMNTADRSVGHIDYAIRRRFAFVEVLPKDLSSEMGDGEFYTDLFSAVKALFTKDDYQTKSDYLSQEFEPKDVTLGHSYFIDKTKDGGDIKTRWNYEIKPILLEYIRDGILKESALEQVISIEATFDLKIQ